MWPVETCCILADSGKTFEIQVISMPAGEPDTLYEHDGVPSLAA